MLRPPASARLWAKPGASSNATASRLRPAPGKARSLLQCYGLRASAPKTKGRPFYAVSPCTGNADFLRALDLRSALLRPVVGELHLGRLAGLDGDFLRLGAVLLVPALDGVLARRHVVDLEAAVRAGDRLQRVLRHADVPAHPGMDVALPLHQARF